MTDLVTSDTMSLKGFCDYETSVGIFDIPDDARVYIGSEDDSKFKCDKFVLLETVSS